MQWQTYSNQDLNSKKSPKSITTTDDLRFEYNATNSPVTISLPYNYIDIKNIAYNGTITLPPYSSVVLIKNGPIITNQPPSILNQNFQLNQNSPNGTVVGTVVATDPDVGQILSYSISSGNTNSAFAINVNTGVLTVANSTALNFESTPTFTLIVKVQDNGVPTLSSQASVTVTLANQPGTNKTFRQYGSV